MILIPESGYDVVKSQGHLGNAGEIKNIVKGKFEKDDAGITLRKFWKPDGNNVVVGNRDTIQAWMDANNVNGSIAFFILSADFAELRVEAVQALGL